MLSYILVKLMLSYYIVRAGVLVCMPAFGDRMKLEFDESKPFESEYYSKINHDVPHIKFAAKK